MSHQLMAVLGAVAILVLIVTLAALRFLFPDTWDRIWYEADDEFDDDDQGDEPEPATVVIEARAEPVDGDEFWQEYDWEAADPNWWDAPLMRQQVSLTRRIHRRKGSGPAGSGTRIYPELASAVAVLDAPTWTESDEQWLARITAPGAVADPMWLDRCMTAYAPGQVGWVPRAIEAGRKAIEAPIRWRQS